MRMLNISVIIFVWKPLKTATSLFWHRSPGVLLYLAFQHFNDAYHEQYIEPMHV